MGNEALADFELLVMLAAMRLGPEAAYTVTIAEGHPSKLPRPHPRAGASPSRSA